MLTFLMTGAHPDDMDQLAGGLAMKLTEKGHQAVFLSVRAVCAYELFFRERCGRGVLFDHKKLIFSAAEFKNGAEPCISLLFYRNICTNM